MISAKTRAIVREYLELSNHTDCEPQQFNNLASRLSEQDDVVPALAEALEDSDPRRRVMAASLISTMAERQPVGQEPDAVKRAGKILSAALQQPEADDRLFPCVLLSGGGVPKYTIRILRRLLQDEDERVRVCAAAALSTCGKMADGIALLEKALVSANETLVTVAASAFGRMKVRREALRHLVAALDSDAPFRYHIVLAVREIGPAALSVAPPLIKILKDRRCDLGLRSVAATALASVTRGTAEGVAPLIEALDGAEPEVVEAIGEAFAILGTCPQKLLRRLARLLESSDQRMRLAAVRALGSLGPMGADALPVLVKSVPNERSIEVMEAMSRALAAAGTSVLPHLVELLKQDDPVSVGVALASYVWLGKAGARALADLLRRETDEELCLRAVAVLKCMGSDAAAAVPVLDMMLRRTTDDETSLTIIAALAVCGPAAIDAAGALIERVAVGGHDVAAWAERVLWQLGPAVIPALRDGMQTANDDAKARLGGILEKLESAGHERFRRFASIDPLLLETFVGVASLLLESERPLGFRELARLLGQRSDAKLRNRLKTLNSLLGVTLIDIRPQRKSILTPQGKAQLKGV